MVSMRDQVPRGRITCIALGAKTLSSSIQYGGRCVRIAPVFSLMSLAAFERHR